MGSQITTNKNYQQNFIRNLSFIFKRISEESLATSMQVNTILAMEHTSLEI
jgi:hypothetical protein